MDGVTILRFIAAFYVFIFHINMRVPVNFGELLNKTISNGVIGMSIFFMLSGFVLTYNYYGSLSKNYFRKRIARIFPAYLFCGLLTLPFLLSSDASFLKMIASIFLFVTGMQSWIYQTFDFWNFSGTWSISVELFFYALFPFLIKSINKNNLIYVLLFSYLSSALLIPLSDIIQGPVVWSVYYATPIYRLPEFVVGICIAILFLNGYRVNHYTWLLSILLFMYATTQQNNNSMGVNYLTIPAISIMLLHLAKIN
ncbi:acyltransferase, partial [Escherichia coli O7:H7]|nr:acyltransferase [Escherichia coli O7:H7]